MSKQKIDVIFDANLTAYESVCDLLPKQYKLGHMYSASKMSDDALQSLTYYRPPLCVLTGGSSDVNPAMYGHEIHPRTYLNQADDYNAERLAALASEYSLPAVGICRGFQYMWAASGGILAQNVAGHHNNHSTTPAPNFQTVGLKSIEDGEPFIINSSHHQVCIPTREVLNAVTLLLLSSSKSTGFNREVARNTTPQEHLHVEAATWFNNNFWAGVQYHPEWSSCPPKGKLFFTELLDDLLFFCGHSPTHGR